ncbi:MAG: hypothetical protein PHC75_07145 [Burkholderiales bacterium]|nr:hypothetical protein [Burkholderiales bacterium]
MKKLLTILFVSTIPFVYAESNIQSKVIKIQYNASPKQKSFPQDILLIVGSDDKIYGVGSTPEIRVEK